MSSVSELRNSLEQIFLSFDRLRDLESRVLSERPAPGKWSVLEIVEHLTNTHQVYSKNISSALEGADLPDTEPPKHYKTTYIGRNAVSFLLPKENKVRFKMKTFGALKPHPLLNEEQVFDRYKRSEDELLGLFDAAKILNFDEIKVNTAVGSILRLPVMEAFAFLWAHEVRHYQQVENNKSMLINSYVEEKTDKSQF